jgi:hypothetical protein
MAPAPHPTTRRAGGYRGGKQGVEEMKPKLFLAALIGLASAITVATQVYAMSSSVADYPEFTSCPLAKGTWWGSGKEAEKYTAGHNMLFVVKESRLLSAEDRSRGSMSEPKEVRFVQRVSGEIQIKALRGTLYNLRKTGDKFTGTMDDGGSGGMPTITYIEFVCTSN